MRDFEAVYAACFDRVYRFTRSLCRDAADAEEITQRAFWNAFRNYARFEGRGDVCTWICRIAKNEYVSLCRRKKAIPLDEAPDRSGGDRPDAKLLESAELDAIRRALHALDEPYKEVFMLRVYAELPHGQIGALFGRSENWARVTFYRAKRMILEEVEKNERIE